MTDGHEHDQRETFCREGNGYAILVRPAGSHEMVVPEHIHLLDIHLGGTKGKHEISGMEHIGQERPANSLIFIPANGERVVRFSSVGWNVQILLSVPLLEKVLNDFSDLDLSPLEALIHMQDPVMTGLAAMVRDISLTSPELTASHYFDAMAKAIMARLAFHFRAEQDKEQANVSAPKRVQKVIEYIEDNLDQQLNLVMLASIANISPYHFARMFRNATSTSLHRYVIDRRIARARQMLVDGDESLSNIAYSCGFGSQSHMTSLFTRILGTTPGKIRKGVVEQPAEMTDGLVGEVPDLEDDDEEANATGSSPDMAKLVAAQRSSSNGTANCAGE